VRPESSGSFKIRVTARGAFSGKLMMQKKIYALRGQLDHLGRARVPVLRRPIKPVVLTLDLDLDGMKEIIGEVTDGEWISKLRGGRIVSGAQAQAVLPRGEFAFNSISGETELGNGIAQINSAIKIRGNFFGENTFAATLFPLESGESAVCIFLKGGSPVVLGWLAWRDAARSPLAGHLILATTNLWTNVEIVIQK
jgi:hypothetical protein